MKKTTFGVIVGNRGFFPDAFAKEGRKNILDVLKNNGFSSVALSMQETKYGTVETFTDAKKCSETATFPPIPLIGGTQNE